MENTFKYKTLELIGIIGHNLIERSNHSDIKEFFRTDIDVVLNRQYNNYDIRKNEFLLTYRWNEYTLIPDVPFFKERTEYISDFKYPSSIIANVNCTKSSLIKINFNLDDSNVVDFHIFKVDLTYTSQADYSTESFSFFAINFMTINGNDILFSEFCDYLDKYHTKFTEVLETLIQDIRQSKDSEQNHIDSLKFQKQEQRKNEILSYIN